MNYTEYYNRPYLELDIFPSAHFGFYYCDVKIFDMLQESSHKTLGSSTQGLDRK